MVWALVEAWTRCGHPRRFGDALQCSADVPTIGGPRAWALCARQLDARVRRAPRSAHGVGTSARGSTGADPGRGPDSGRCLEARYPALLCRAGGRETRVVAAEVALVSPPASQPAHPRRLDP